METKNVLGVVLLLIALFLVGYYVYGGWNYQWYPGPMRMMGGQQYKITYSSNGERIYYTGYNDEGQRIGFSGGPMWLSIHGGSCVDCHGVDGKGGRYIMMSNVIPPDIRYNTLTRMHEEDHPPYTDETIKRALREGIDPAGESLETTMPRWHMSDKDVRDVVEYLKVLDEGKVTYQEYPLYQRPTSFPYIFLASVLVLIGVYMFFSSKKKSHALQILEERYAKGEIKEEQYIEMKRELKR